MMIKGIYILSLIFIVSTFGCGKSTEGNSSIPDTTQNKVKNTHVLFTDNNIQYEGRVSIKEGDATYLYWPGTTVRLKFKGTGIEVTLQDDSWNKEKYRNYLNVFIDGVLRTKIKVEKQKKSYVLANALSNKEHVVELFKLNSMHPSYPRGYVKLYGFLLKGEQNELLPPPELKKRKMEFYGNSITCGYGDESQEGKNNASIYENNYLAYGAITARHFNAQYYCIAKSGIGLIKGSTTPNMQQMYKLTNPFDVNSKWDFSKYTPDIVVVNLLQNDKSYIPNKPSSEIIDAYKDFLSNIRNKYNDAYIICLLGPMNVVTKTKWRNIVLDAVQEFNDDKVFTHFFTYLGRSGHPLVSDQQQMANSLIDFIENNKDIHW